MQNEPMLPKHKGALAATTMPWLMTMTVSRNEVILSTKLNLPVFEVPEKQRIWVVRAEQGDFLPNFLRGRLIAIGHLDQIQKPDEDLKPYVLTEDILGSLAKSLQSKKESKSTITSVVNQVKTFVEELNVGDLVLTPSGGSHAYMVGKLVSSCFYSREPIVVERQEQTKTVLTYGLRRHVKWGPLVEATDLPYSLVRSLRARQTVFNVDDHWQSLYHALLPVFTKHDNLYLSFKILREDDIPNDLVATFFGFLTDLEAFSSFQKRNWSTDNFEMHIRRMREANQLRLYTKAQFFSSGLVEAVFSGIDKHEELAKVVVAYMMVFGGAGFSGLIDLQTRHKIFKFVASRWTARGGDKVKRDLELSQPQYDVSALTKPSARTRSKSKSRKKPFD